MKTNINQYLNSKNKNKTTTTDIASYDDVLTEILLRLPIRSLLRSKCVSKHWRSLISHPRFALARNPNPIPPSGLFLQRFRNININLDITLPNYANYAVYEYDFVPFDRNNDNGNGNVKAPFKRVNLDGKNGEVMVLDSSNGLLLCYRLDESFCKVTRGVCYDAMYYVYNPTISHYVKLPKPEGCDWVRRRPRGLTLVFDPVKFRYRVVCVGGHLWSDHLFTVEVYCSGSGRWRTCGKAFADEVDTEFMGGVYWNDAVHWVNKKGYVFYLKIDEERVDRVETPVLRAGWNVRRHCYPLVGTRECLLFIDVFPPSSMKLDVHEMNRDYSGWSLKYHVDLSQVITRFPETHIGATFGLGYMRLVQSFVVHCLVVGEREEDSFLVFEIPGKAIRYNIVLNTFEELCDLEISKTLRSSVADDGFSKLGRWPGAFLFFESLSHV